MLWVEPRSQQTTLVVEITSEAGKSYLDEMVGLIQNATRPKTQNEISFDHIVCRSFI